MKKQAAKETRRDEIVPEKTSEDGKVVLDIIEAIHAAEKKQADADAYMYSEEKRKLKVCIYNFCFSLFMVFILLQMQGLTLVYLCGLHYFHHFLL